MCPYKNRKWGKEVKALALYLSVFFACTMLAGCGKGTSGPEPDGAIQIINAIDDSPTLSFEIKLSDDDTVTQNLGSLDFQRASAITGLAAATYELTVRYVDPESGTDFNLMSSFIFDVEPNIMHALVLRGAFSNPSISMLDKDLNDIFDDSDDIDEIEVQVFNLSDDTVNVYLGDPDSTLSSETLIGTFGFDSASKPTLIEDGENSLYRLRITEDSTSRVVYDSGDFDIPASGRRLIIINDGFGPDPDTKSAFVVVEGGASIYHNEVAHAGIRLFNAVADAAIATVEVTVPSTSEQVANSALAFRQVTDFITVDPSFLNVGVEFPDDSDSAINTTVSLNQDTFFTVVVGGSFLDGSVAIQAAQTAIRPVATGTNIQFVNGLDTTTIDDYDRVDLYALPIGDALADAAPNLGQVGFLSSASSTVPATAVDLVITTAGTQSILAGPTRVNLQGGTEVLVVITQAVGGGGPNQLVIHTTDSAQ